MADFAATQTAVNSARDVLDRAQLLAQQASARARQAQSALDAALRSQRDRQDGGDGGRVAELKAVVERTNAVRDAALTGVQRARASLGDVSGRFAEFSDPRRTISVLSDASPFLLFPVRIETRFRTIVQRDTPVIVNPPVRHQLWVRIYPDDCSIDTFEPMLSSAELTNVKNYWMNIWRAGGVENDERGAWRNLVAAHGSGRATWLTDNFSPAAAAPRPVKVETSDMILVIPTATPLAAAEATAIDAYWQGVWLADGDRAKLQAAQTALEASVGAARAAQLVAAYVPFNLADKPAKPLKKMDVRLSTAFVVFPPDPDTTLHSWSQAPQVRQFPDRFVVLGFSNQQKTFEALGNRVVLPFYAGPDPSAVPSETIRPDPAPNGPDLFVPDELKWMVDFDRAVAAGLGMAVDLTPEQFATGFDLLLVVGLKLSTPADAGPAALQELLTHHQFGRSGFEIVPQGTPAHNSPGSSSGHTGGDDADATFADHKNRPLFTPVADPLEKRDGQWLAELLGLDPQFVGGIHGSDGLDQRHARAMQTAMWPATFGYWLNTLFTPSGAKESIFSDDAIDRTRAFFTAFVSGRGPLPAIRIGGQPYGILPTTAFSRIQWHNQPVIRDARASQAFFANLYRILQQVDADWTTMAGSAHWVGDGDDPHQTLLNVVAHHPSSVEYFSRNAESGAQLFNMVNLWALGPQWWQAVLNMNLQAQATALLQSLGYTGSELPDLLNHFFLTDNPRITTIIDDRPLSETDRIRAYTPTNRNYIQWLIDAAGSLETLRAETGFTDNKSPQALLYLYLRHALMLGYYESSYNYHRNTGVLTAAALHAMRTESPFIHVETGAASSESRFAALYKTESRITGSATTLVSEHIGAQMGQAGETANLAAQVTALEALATASTAELERVFAEHIDTCSYRLDSWLLGLVNQRLITQRASLPPDVDQPRPSGLYLGAYAWVEHLKPAAPPTPAQVPAAVAERFAGAAPLMVDQAGGGYVHAPSMPHAGAAAVLRAGYIANAGQANPDMLAVNLSSDRVRIALSLIEGIRNGQSLGALLGYRFERGLHDAHQLGEVDKFIYPLRKAFPLAADQLSSTKTDPNVPIEAIEARNVLDGRKLLDRVQTSGVRTYPYGLPDLPAPAAQAEQDALNAQTDALLDAYDAVADLALAEGVYQAVQGNYDRVASTLESYTTGNFPPEPQVVQTPPAGVNLTHRVAVQLRPGLAAAAGATPRAIAEPAVDEWLSRILPALNGISCTVTWKDPVTGAPQTHAVSLGDLGLRPLDVIYLLKPDNAQAMAELDDRITRFIASNFSPRPDAEIHIQYLVAGPGTISMFEAGPLLRELRTLVTGSRPLRATDVRLPNESTENDNAQVFADAGRVAGPLADLEALANDIKTFLDGLSPVLADTQANRAAIIANVDNTLAQAVALLDRAARFAQPSAGWGFAYGWLHTAFTDLLAQVSSLVTRWTRKLTDFSNALIAYDALPIGTSDEDRFAALQAAELLVHSRLDPLLATPALVRLALPAKGNACQSRLNDFTLAAAAPGAAFAPLFNQIAGLSTTEFDSQPFDVTSFGDRAVVITGEVFRIVSGQAAAIAKRVKDTHDQLTIAASAGSDADRVQAVQTAAKRLFGDDFQIVPEFTISAAQGAEWANAVAASGGPLLDYLQNTLNIDFPVDEWLYGAARVRPPLHSWETMLMLDGAFAVVPPVLTPIQLPHAPADPWLALEYPDTYTIDSDRLLYTCAYSDAFNPNARQCGLLIDEWTEVIPATTRDTALTFNFNRPDNEPPQTMLLVTSPSITGTWAWTDLVDALVETLALAKKRAVEPASLDPTVYSRFLPATVTASTSYAITISTALAAANGTMDLIQGGSRA